MQKKIFYLSLICLIALHILAKKENVFSFEKNSTKAENVSRKAALEASFTSQEKLFMASTCVHGLQDQPKTGVLQAHTINVTFTSCSIPFGMTTSCLHLDTSNIIMTNALYGSPSFHASHFFLADSMHITATFNIPANEPIGEYNVSLGSNCQVSLDNSLEIHPYTPPPPFSVSTNPQAHPGETIGVTFTDSQQPGRFLNSATNCLYTDTSNTYFVHDITGFRLNPGPLTHTYNTLNFNMQIPVNAPLGYYNAIAGEGSACPLKCLDCLQLYGSNSSTNTSYPNLGKPGQTLTVTLTNTQNQFSQSTGCVKFDTTNILFIENYPQYGYSFKATGFNVVNSSVAKINVTIPPNAPLGDYDMHFGTGTCSYNCNSCFHIASSVVSQDLSARISTPVTFINLSSNDEVDVLVTNNGLVTEKANIIVTLDSGLIPPFNSYPFTPDSIRGQKIYYTFDSLAYGDLRKVPIYTHVNSFLTSGTKLKSYVTVYPVVGDTNTHNNSDTLHQVFYASYDPNNKSVYPAGGITPADVGARKPLDYTVDFQNTGAAPAFNILVTDTLSNLLDLSTFEFISSSHYSTYDLSPSGVLKVMYYNIMLPDSAADQAKSHGYFRYKISPKTSAVVGNVINNAANIYFDNNPAVITNTTHTPVQNITHIGDISAKQNTYIYYPNPSSGIINIIGEEVKGGSVYVYDIVGKELLKIPFDYTLNMQSLEAGSYFILIKDKASTTLSAKKILLLK